MPTTDRSAQNAPTTPRRHRGPTNARLLEACRTGDEKAWATLVERYERLVFSIALRTGLDRDDAADVTQLTFATLLESADRINDPDSLGWWLTTVAQRTSRRIADRRHREVATDEQHFDITAPCHAEHLTQVLMLHEGLARLDAGCRALLTALFAQEERTYVEVARSLGRPVGSIGPMRARCLDHLRDLITDQDDGATPATPVADPEVRR